MNISFTMQKRGYGLVGAGALLFGAGLWLAWPKHHRAGPKLVYTSQGYGGFVPAPAAPKPGVVPFKASAAPRRTVLTPARDAYSAGRWQEAEAQAQRVIRQAPHTVAGKTQAAFARQILAYAAARRHDLPLARVRFATLQTDAAQLPDKGKEPAPVGQMPSTLEAEGAFQHAVCTGALGNKEAAEGEYRAFMQRYPDSVLVAAAIKRIARFHGGDIPKVDEAVWRQAQQTAQAHERARQRDASLCGPECLAELLRRRGESVTVHALAQEMGTSEQGTSLAALATAAKQHGFRAEGLALTPKGLQAQTGTLIALLSPGHYVLVDKVAAEAVTVWDPDARGVGHGQAQTITLPEWNRRWRGLALAVHPSEAALQTARR